MQFGRITTIRNQIHKEGSVLKEITKKDILPFVIQYPPVSNLKRSFTQKMAFNSKSTPTLLNF